MNKSNFIICLLILLTFLALSFSVTILALQVTNHDSGLITTNNQLITAITKIKQCNFINYPESKFVNHFSYLKFSTYLIIIGSGLNLINLIQLIVYLIKAYRRDEKFSDQIQKLQFLNKFLSFLKIIPILSYFGYMLSFYLDLNKIKCDIGTFNLSSYRNSYLNIMILSGMIVFLCLNQIWISIISVKQQKYQSKQEQGNNLDRLKVNVEQISVIKPILVTKHNIYKRNKIDQKIIKQQKIEEHNIQKVQNNQTINHTQQDFILSRHSQNVLSNIQFNPNIIESTIKNQKTGRSSNKSLLELTCQLGFKKYDSNKQNDPKSFRNIVTQLQKQQSIILYLNAVLPTVQQGITPLQQSEQIIEKERSDGRKK